MTSGSVPPPPPVAPASKAPVRALWICMIAGWVFFLAPIPGTVFLAGPLNLAAFVLAIVCLTRSRVGHGVAGLVGTTVVAAVLYFIGLGLTVLGAAAITESAARERQTAAIGAVANATGAMEAQASGMSAEYAAAPSVAEAKYRGRVVRVVGVVDSVGEFANYPLLVLRTNDPSRNPGLKCLFPEGQGSRLAGLAKGDDVVVMGQCQIELGNMILFGARVVD